MLALTRRPGKEVIITGNDTGKQIVIAVMDEQGYPIKIVIPARQDPEE